MYSRIKVLVFLARHLCPVLVFALRAEEVVGKDFVPCVEHTQFLVPIEADVIDGLEALTSSDSRLEQKRFAVLGALCPQIQLMRAFRRNGSQLLL